MLPPDLLLRTTTTCSWRSRGTRPSPTRSSSSRRLCVDSKRGKHVKSRHDAISSQKLDNTHDDDDDADDAIYNPEHFVLFSCCWTTEVPPLLFWVNLAVGAIEDNTVWWILTVWSLSPLCRTNFLRLRSAVTVIQKVWRGYRCMRNYRTVSPFQLFCCVVCFRSLYLLLFFFLEINSYPQSHLSSPLGTSPPLFQMQSGFLRLQAVYRSRKYYVSYQKTRLCVTLIQARCRGFLLRQTFWRRLRAVLTLQAYTRGMIARRLCQRLRAEVNSYYIYYCYLLCVANVPDRQGYWC